MSFDDVRGIGVAIVLVALTAALIVGLVKLDRDAPCKQVIGAKPMIVVDRKDGTVVDYKGRRAVCRDGKPVVR